MSTIQSACQTSGAVLGALAMLKFTSTEFAKSIGLTAPIMSIQTFYIIVVFTFLIPIIIVHFRFQETYVEKESFSQTQSIFKVISYYRVFFMPSYRYFRSMVLLIFYYQGFNFFLAGYNYELVKKGFSRDSMNTIDNLTTIFVTLLTFLLGSKASYFGRSRTMVFELSLTIVVLTYLWIWFPLEIAPYAIAGLLVGIFSNWDFILTT